MYSQAGDHMMLITKELLLMLFHWDAKQAPHLRVEWRQQPLNSVH